MEMWHQVEALFAIRPIDGRQVSKHVEFFFVAQIQRHFRELAALQREDRLFAILDRFQKSRAELATNPRDQFVVEWSLQRHGRFWSSGGRWFRRSAGRSRARRLGGWDRPRRWAS